MKSTRKSLAFSALSLLICISMLLGTTFAWFTDSVTSGVNKIEAGNLDIEVEYKNDNTSSWKNLQNSDTVFSKNLWEPGHTEFVTLKITNKGTLALKYRMNVSPIDEVGGINVNGKAFKLSDYLVFGTTTPAETEPVYTRDNARAAVGTTKGLTQSALTQNETLLPKEIDYISLVVYMPESVGNEANYKTGTTAPEVDLGITFLATQLASEYDSFGNDYDNNVDYNASDIALIYNFFPQIDVTGQLEIDGTEVKKGSTAGEETTVTKINETTSKVVLASSDKIEEKTAAKLTTVLNKGTLNNDETGSLTLKVVKDDTANANFQATQTSSIDTTKQDSTTYQVTVKTEGVVAVPEETGKAKFKVELFIGQNRNNVKMYHNTVAMTNATTEAAETYSYDSETGYVSMFVDNFSPFTTVYDLPVAAIGTTVYYSLKEAFDAVPDNGTIVLLKDIDNVEGISLDTKKTFTFNFDGHTYTVNKPGAGSSGTQTSAFQLLKDQTITFKNGTIKAAPDNLTLAEAPAKNIKRFFQSYANVNFVDMTIDGTNIYGNNSVIEFACGNVSITGKTSITAKSGVKAINVDTWKDYYPAGAAVTINTTGTIGDIYLYSEGTGTDYVKSSLTITGGTFGSVTDDGSNEYTASISGGTFSADPTKYVVAQYKANNNGNNTWTVLPKVTPQPDANGVFTVGTNEDLEAVLDVLNTDADYADKPYTIKLGSGVTGATYDAQQKKYIANVYVIPQYIGWKYNNNTGYAELIAGKKAKVTIIGDTGSEKLTFRGIFVVTGHGYSNGGDSCYDPNAATTIQNLNFDFTDVVGVSGATTDLMKGPKYSPIIACGACSNLTIDKCSFINTERIKTGYAQGNNTPDELYNNDGLVTAFKGYAFCTVISNCTYENCACIADGYPAGRSDWTNTNGKYGLNISNVIATGMTSGGVNTQTGGGGDILITNSSISGSGYGVRMQGGNTALIKDTSICIIDGDNNVLAFKGNANNTVTLENVTIPTGGSVNINSNTAGNSVICKGTTPKANQFTTNGSNLATVTDFAE